MKDDAGTLVRDLVVCSHAVLLMLPNGTRELNTQEH